MTVSILRLVRRSKILIVNQHRLYNMSKRIKGSGIGTIIFLLTSTRVGVVRFATAMNVRRSRRWLWCNAVRVGFCAKDGPVPEGCHYGLPISISL